MSYRATFDCLWCGTPWTTRGPTDLEGWALLCPGCLGRAGTNPFLKGRLRTALAERAGASRVVIAAGPDAVPDALPDGGPDALSDGGPDAGPDAVPDAAPDALSDVPRPAAARGSRVAPAYPAFPDDWFLRRGPFERGAIHDAAWAAELDMLTRWLDGLPLAGRIVEPAAGVGFFSPLLAEKGELSACDADAAALDRARDRLLAHHLRAHLHVADPFARDEATPPGITAAGPGVGPGGPAPERGADVVVAAFLLGRVRGAGLDLAAGSLRARLRSGGRLALVELRPDSAGGPPPGIAWTWHDPALVEAALGRAGFKELTVGGTGRFFLTASAVAR